MGSEASGEHPVPALHRLLPERNPIPVVVLAVRHVTPPRVADQDVEAILLGSDLLEKRSHGPFVRVVTSNRDASTAPGSDFFGGVLDGVRIFSNRWLPSDAPPGDVDRSALLAQDAGNASPGPPAGPGHDGDLVLERRHGSQHSQAPGRPKRNSCGPPVPWPPSEAGEEDHPRRCQAAGGDLCSCALLAWLPGGK